MSRYNAGFTATHSSRPPPRARRRLHAQDCIEDPHADLFSQYYPFEASGQGGGGEGRGCLEGSEEQRSHLIFFRLSKGQGKKGQGEKGGGTGAEREGQATAEEQRGTGVLGYFGHPPYWMRATQELSWDVLCAYYCDRDDAEQRTITGSKVREGRQNAAQGQ
ncbi:hypothetical protein M430DRAFT_54975 [Amorphotheca resinae ATCC 22711]|uniref:Uncharacterized protein n=1 Tax=Amorphotheca resinae ATCC 22711 TaxID=857342 RepID=A0A2T3BDH2_AMORE|nr:hypothetical protein M430DRAFT_54975 [Amorphotheca resinae ATCC 22711]PSS27460.1 hypothetical protein M430DRAFT_54975 [Amorphotheca resinae ATCC 22711]